MGGTMIDAVGFGDNLAEMKRPVIVSSHVHTIRKIGHPGFRLVSYTSAGDR